MQRMFWEPVNIVDAIFYGATTRQRKYESSTTAVWFLNVFQS
jgi:hypothetical protein